MRDAFISPPPASKCSRSINEFGKPYSLDVTGTVKAPGYLPVAYWGPESIGFNPLYNQNPETMYRLSYYYDAPLQWTCRGA